MSLTSQVSSGQASICNTDCSTIVKPRTLWAIAGRYRIFQIEKATSLFESILTNHPFVDGNKRIGYVLMRLLLLKNGLDINASQDQKYEFVMGVASSQTNHEEIISWLKINSENCNG